MTELATNVLSYGDNLEMLAFEGTWHCGRPESHGQTARYRERVVTTSR